MRLNFTLLLAISIGFLVSCSNGQSPLGKRKLHEITPLNNSDRKTISLTDDHLSNLMDETNEVKKRLIDMQNRLIGLKKEIITYRRFTKNESNLKKPPMMESRAHENNNVAPLTSKQKNELMKPKTIIVSRKSDVLADSSRNGDSPNDVASKTYTNVVKSIRTGIHNDKTRIVIDMNNNINHVMNYDKQANIVTITLPETQWRVLLSQTYNFEQFSGYEAKQTGQGAIIAMAIQKTSNVKSMTLSNPSRLVVDLIK